MSTPFYDLASLVVVPSGYKSGKVYAQKPLTTDGQLTFTRASSATRVASNGLIEKVRTNLVLQSNTFSTTWANSDSNETSGQAGYDGTNNAWLLTTTLSGGYIIQSVALNGLTTFSAYAKAGTQNGIILYSVHVAQGINFNLSTGVVGAAFVAAPLGSRIESIGNGWYRCSITVSSSSTNNFRIYVSDGSNPSIGNALIQNAQVETGDIATDYIPTTTAAVSVGPVSGLPRLDYLNSTCPKLLLEPQRTNLVTFSEQFNNADWTKLDTAVTANAGTSPDGNINADKIVPNTSIVRHILFQSNTASAVHTFSVFAKAAGQNFLTMRLDDDTPEVNVYFNLSTGTIGSTAGGSPTMTSYGNGWYRCTVTYTPSGTETIYAVLGSANQNGVQAYAGNNTDGILLYGAQLEAGAYATSYIPTLGASVTRVADAASKTGISSLIGQTEGTLYWDGVYTQGNYNQLMFIKDSAANQFIGISLGAGVIYGEIYNAGYVHLFLLSIVSTLNRCKIAIAYKTNDFAFYVNGTQVAVATTGTTPTSFDDFYLDSPSAARIFSAQVNQALLFKTRLTNAQLAELTAL